ncbi:MAG TPA: P1 family peptidase [Methylomirabilota bacterium]|nr:P1 family peptidase [Methylomirabilota bacterium]
MITDVPGIRVGHATDLNGLTGCTVILPEREAVGGVEQRGWATGVFGLDVLDPRHLTQAIHGVVLAGGSAFGLEAIWGVMQHLEEQGVGYLTGAGRVPLVVGAILFDLNLGDPKARPNRAMGYEACKVARAGAVPEGSVGAGTGATVGKLFGVRQAMKGGVGTASAKAGDLIVGALIAVNAVGDVKDPESGQLIAGSRDAPEGRRLVDSAKVIREGKALPRFASPQHTTIGVVATNARLTKPEATKVAQLSMLGYAKALSPPHTTHDGDVLFCLSVGNVQADLSVVGLLGSDAVAYAIVRAVKSATSLGGVPAWQDLRDSRA